MEEDDEIGGGVVMDIDWSKAPEDATHYDPSDDGLEMPWVKLSEGRFYCWEDNIGWHGPLDPNDGFFGDGNVNRIIPRPTKPASREWSGEGLPPVGCECELKIDQSDWLRGTVKYVNKCGVVFKPWGTKLESFISSATTAIQFRPIRTKEQRQRDELVQSIKDYHLEDGWNSSDEGLADFLVSRYNLEPKDV